jgi:hypothetical protein
MPRKHLVLTVALGWMLGGCAGASGPVEHPTTAPIVAANSAKRQATAEHVATPAAFNTAAASTQPASNTPAPNLADAFDSQLQRLINPTIDTAAATSNLAPDDQQLLGTVIDAIASFRITLRDENGLMATRVAPLVELSQRIRSQTPLSLPTLALCRSVTQFGVYDAFEPARFAAGRENQTIVYCEVDNFSSRPETTDGTFETKLSYEAVLYSEGEHAVAVIGKKPTSIVDRCRNRRRDFFLADRLLLPANLPAGKYVLKVTVIDQFANRVAEKSVSVLIAPN